MTATISAAIVRKGLDGHGLATLLTDRPEQFGELRRKVGRLDENKERKAARR